MKISFNKWSLIVPFLLTSVMSLNGSPPQYSVITADNDQLENFEIPNEYELPEVNRRGYTGEDFRRKVSKSIPRMGIELPIVIRRGYAGEDFYQKASKSIPRMGRRSNPDPTSYNCRSVSEFLTEDHLQNSLTSEITNELMKQDVQEILKNKLKRFHSISKEASAWPWYKDHIPDLSKRNEFNENCHYLPKSKNYNTHEIYNDDLICCSSNTDSKVLKRHLSTFSSKQTTTVSPDYKTNRFM